MLFDIRFTRSPIVDSYFTTPLKSTPFKSYRRFSRAFQLPISECECPNFCEQQKVVSNARHFFKKWRIKKTNRTWKHLDREEIRTPARIQPARFNVYPNSWITRSHGIVAWYFTLGLLIVFANFVSMSSTFNNFTVRTGFLILSIKIHGLLFRRHGQLPGRTQRSSSEVPPTCPSAALYLSSCNAHTTRSWMLSAPNATLLRTWIIYVR